MKRGALIVIEGIDRTGKSTQGRNLVESLRKQNIPAEYRTFPDRTTEIGKVINSYLTLQSELSDEAIHLLFSANRWELKRNMVKTLEAGTTIILDRYCYSGVAFSGAKGLDLKWCMSADAGLPLPDKVFFLTLPIETTLKRNGFGNERYEVMDFQKKVRNVYSKLKDDTWDVLDANRPIETIHEELLSKTLKIIDNTDEKPMGTIWEDIINNRK